MVTSAETQNNSDDRWMTSREAATYLGYKLQTVYNKVATDPTFPHEKAGGYNLRFKKSELDAWVRGQTPDEASAA